ncbi:MAG: flagellar basal-body rod protein FlgF [Hydrogenophaga sp.]|jgi:flagellar basal-body rod protein FlgF|uniref:flagellar basal-body rod protein FlgF n=1 Tax=Hydrogenophaga sp. TaxID=1904254 RepID=UPI0025BCA3A3|nr:flagellar basal-body rod protein FlgF [Hydrogenophaga sp.]MBU7572473.1 flagellar basal-body rod protein FlgF [Hydrogenophaga sp.]MCW5669838.1 flagellar basal-body rod protein FlgF [Hydrogenophaga sp.]
MDRMIYTAMTGANAAQYRQQVLANNLANVSTPGFRAELSTFRAVPVRGDGASTRVFALEATPGHSDLPGSIAATGRNLDVAARGNAYFAVQGLDGTEAYTRAGALEVNQDGTLVSGQGLPMLGDGGPIVIPEGARVDIASDGTVSTRIGNQPSQTVGRLKMVTPDADNPLRRSEDGLFRGPQGDPLPASDVARLQDGALEGSNVNPMEAMVGMIAVARQFEVQMRMLQNGETNDKTASQLLSMNG